MTPGPSTPWAPARVRRAVLCGAWTAAALYAVQGLPSLVLLIGGGADGSAEFRAATDPLYTELGWVLACAAFGACHAVAALLTGGRAPGWTLLAAIAVPPVVHAVVGTRAAASAATTAAGTAGSGDVVRTVGDAVTSGLLPTALLVSLVAAMLCRFVMQYWDPAEGTRPAGDA